MPKVRACLGAARLPAHHKTRDPCALSQLSPDGACSRASRTAWAVQRRLGSPTLTCQSVKTHACTDLPHAATSARSRAGSTRAWPRRRKRLGSSPLLTCACRCARAAPHEPITRTIGTCTGLPSCPLQASAGDGHPWRTVNPTGRELSASRDRRTAGRFRPSGCKTQTRHGRRSQHPGS